MEPLPQILRIQLLQGGILEIKPSKKFFPCVLTQSWINSKTQYMLAELPVLTTHAFYSNCISLISV